MFFNHRASLTSEQTFGLQYNLTGPSIELDKSNIMILQIHKFDFYRWTTGGLNIGQLTWNEPNKWLVPFFLCYHTAQDSYDGWRKKLQPQLELITIKG